MEVVNSKLENLTDKLHQDYYPGTIPQRSVFLKIKEFQANPE